MTNKNRLLNFAVSCFILFFLLISPLGFSQAPKYSNEFLSIGVGGRSLGMSNANIASIKDVTAGYWNPAGLLEIKEDMQVGLMHSEYFAGIAKYDYAGIARKLDSSSTLAFSFIRFGVDNIPNTTELIDAGGNVNYDKITQFSAADYAFLISYARSPKIKGLQLGANAKIIRRVIGDFAGAWGFGLDAGIKYNYNGWQVGAMAKDLTSTFNAWSYTLSDEMKKVFMVTGNELPENSLEITLPRVIVGVSKSTLLAKDLTLLGELNGDFTFDGMRNVLFKGNPVSADPRLGIELGYKNMLFLRGGIMNFQTEKNILGRPITTVQPNMGVGVKIKRMSIDYAKTDIGNQSVALSSHVFSLRIDFNKSNK
jgi:hypothetical protein